MRAALLICDRVPEYLRSVHGDYPEMFAELLPEINLDPFFVLDGEFPEVSDYVTFICSGSRRSVYEEIDWISQLKQFTREVYEQDRKFIGVCFGHQLIAESLGGKVERHDNGFLIGVHKFQVIDRKEWMVPSVNEFNVLMLCQDQIRVLPPNSRVLCSSPECPVGMFTVGDHFLGIQGHPEFTKEYNRDVFESRRDRIDSDKIKMAIASMVEEPSKALISGYIMNFMGIQKP